jgi:transcriptional accessory protein Tex/SPT6
MDLAMVKQEQGETLRKYMRHFFDKRATVVDVTDKEVIDLFQDGLYHCRNFEDFGRRHPSSITKLKDMITSWADEEDKANAKYDAIRGKSKNNPGGSNNNNRDQGVTTTTTTRVLTASASRTIQSRLSSALRKTTRRRPSAASKTC